MVFVGFLLLFVNAICVIAGLIFDDWAPWLLALNSCLTGVLAAELSRAVLR